MFALGCSYSAANKQTAMTFSVIARIGKSLFGIPCVAGVSGRVTQDPIFTCRKNLSTDNVSQEAKLTFIKLIIY
jgi:hypothetical protein